MNELQEHFEVAGWFKLEAVAEDGSRRLLADWFPNLITDQGLDRIGGTSGLWDRAMVGTGNAAPAVTDTQLQTFLASTTNNLGHTGANSGSPNYIWSSTGTFRFATGTAAGNLSEVGVGWQNSGGQFSRALIVDGGGTPVTITVLPSEALDVTYQLRAYPTLTDATSSVVISGVTYNLTRRVANISGFDGGAFIPVGIMSPGISARACTGALGAITANPAGCTGNDPGYAWGSYVSGSFAQTVTLTASLTQLNAGGAGMAAMYLLPATAGRSPAFPAMQISFSPVFPKDGTKTCTLQVRYTWARRP